MVLSHICPKLLVLGAGGKVGRMLSRYWRHCPPEGFDPIFQTSGARPFAAAPLPAGHVRWQPGDDLAPFSGVRALLVLWGVTAGSERGMRHNTDLALAALDMAAALGAERVLIASSAAVYTGSQAERHREDDTLAPPPGAYGQAKLEMERAARQWAQKHRGPRLSLLRMANVVGADSLFASLDRGGEVRLDRFASGGGPQRSYLAIEDLARAVEVLATCAEDALPGVVNLAGERALAMADLVREAGARAVWRPAPPSALERVELDTARLRRLVGAGALSGSSDPAGAIASWRRWGGTGSPEGGEDRP